MTKSIQQLAALDTRVEAALRTRGAAKLGELAGDASVKEAGDYNSVMYALKRLMKAGRVTASGLSKARTYTLAPGMERIASVAQREPKLGDMVWALDGSAIVYGQLVGIRQRLGEPVRYELDPSLGMDPVTRVALDGCKLVRHIENSPRLREGALT